MSVTLNPATEERINDWITRGRYPDADTLLADALTLLEEGDLADLRAKRDSAAAQFKHGEGIPFTPELVADMRRRAEDRRLGDEPHRDRA